MDTMKYLGFPVYPVHQIIPINWMDIQTTNAPTKCILSSESGVLGKNRSSTDIPLVIGECPFRPFKKKRESLFYLKKYINRDFNLSWDAKYYYEIRSYEHDMSLGVSLKSDKTWIPWNDGVEYAYLVDDELPNDSPYLSMDTVRKKAIAYEAFGYETELESTLFRTTRVAISFRNILMNTQCLWFDNGLVMHFEDCDTGNSFSAVSYPIYNPPGLSRAADEYHNPRLDLINSKERVIPPYIAWFPFRQGTNVFYVCFPGCLIVNNDTNNSYHDFDFNNILQ
eukprot:NODE_251_length_12882_cov_0.075334.p6 type:complete len:281 gc:universal NODE_251_length_12882_cov_0.075334:9345-10187(+)